jgi:hypothetical protein
VSPEIVGAITRPIFYIAVAIPKAVPTAFG